MFPPAPFPPFGFGNFPTTEPQTIPLKAPVVGVQSGVPVGAIIAFPGEILQQTLTLNPVMTDLSLMPWMVCNGDPLLIAEYPELFNVIGGLYGSSEGSFHLPDYRGYFMRGVDTKHMRDLDGADRTPPVGPAVQPTGVGSTQLDALRDHEHHIPTKDGLGEGKGGPLEAPSNSTATQQQTVDIVDADTVHVSEHETRAMNIAINWLIKTKPDV